MSASNTRTVSIVVSDSGPLITLGVLDRLDLLLVPGHDVLIPDFVYFEAATKLDRSGALLPGAKEIDDWIYANRGQVSLSATPMLRRYVEAFELGRRPDRDLGERACIHTIRRLVLDPSDVVVLLTEDNAAHRDFQAMNDGRFVTLSSVAFLRMLESVDVISSAQTLIDQARAKSRGLNDTNAVDSRTVEQERALQTLLRNIDANSTGRT